jgi:hypothetical protein
MLQCKRLELQLSRELLTLNASLDFITNIIEEARPKISSPENLVGCGSLELMPPT